MGDKKISENGIESAAELLYKGAKMLAYSCPECKMPLFEKDGKVFCPSCGREVIIEGENENSEVQAESETAHDETALEKAKPEADYLGLSKKIERAISKVCDMIAESRSVEEIKVLSESLERLVDVLKKIKE
ncbi:Sjogren's syndrome/scleroderma autoantigen 1 family protein [Archaeoglobus sp.]|uniref:Sjogren's syndrome/scleroderma autoantigen 1 family protein n=1 Tax=Archaeoglobus sp. TaxID=1872626 RepID=UPI0025C32B38|nr:Sjogren's syndrome/scleroderma autoantigen 1 family protein [Archaeoglobus sp.]